MAKPISIGFTFQTQSGPIPLSELDTNFSAAYAAINDFGTYSNYLVDTSGAANVVTLTTPTNTTFNLVAGVGVQFKLANTTTSASVTVNINGTGAVTLLNSDGSALVSGQFVAGQLVPIMYNGTNYVVLNPQPSNSGGSYTALFASPPPIGSTTPNTGAFTTLSASSTVSGVGFSNYLASPPSIGATTPAAGKFTTLQTTGNVVISAPSSGVALTVNAASGQAGLVNTGSSTIGQSLQVQGAGTSGFTGAGTELYNTGTAGAIQAYNRTGAAYLPMNVIGSTVSLQIGANAALAIDASSNTNVYINSSAFSTSYGGVGGLRINNLYFQMQSSIDFGLNGTLVARLRADYGGNINYVATSTGAHTFYVGGDNGTGTVSAEIASNGGLFMNGATGGSQGAGTINATGLYVNGVAVGSGSTTVYKPATATEGRASSTTPTNSTQLTYAITATGTYQIECLVFFYNVSSPTAGVNFNINYSGTFTATSSPLQENSAINSVNVASSVGNALFTDTGVSNSASTPYGFLIKGSITVTGTGTLAMAFAQNSASVNQTTLGIGSYLNVTKVA
jgi:hypothetical protein